jgi:hypothetical protein
MLHGEGDSYSGTRWRPDGDVDVISGHFRIPPVKSVNIMSEEIGGVSVRLSWLSIRRVSERERVEVQERSIGAV